MTHAYADVLCSCGNNQQYHCHSHDKGSFLAQFKHNLYVTISEFLFIKKLNLVGLWDSIN